MILAAVILVAYTTTFAVAVWAIKQDKRIREQHQQLMSRPIAIIFTQATWARTNMVLGAGEIGYENNGGCGVKVGDGHTHWRDLPYLGSIPR